MFYVTCAFVAHQGAVSCAADNLASSSQIIIMMYLQELKQKFKTKLDEMEIEEKTTEPENNF